MQGDGQGPGLGGLNTIDQKEREGPSRGGGRGSEFKGGSNLIKQDNS
jgi:hypothetical protein